MCKLESSVGSESDYDTKSKEISDGENNIPSPCITLTNSHNGQNSCNNMVRKYIILYVHRFFWIKLHKYIFFNLNNL